MSGLINSPIVSSAPKVTRYTTAGAHTWHKPNNISKVLLEWVAGGGGGGGGRGGTDNTNESGGGGGGGGAIHRKIFNADDLPSALILTVGPAGSIEANGGAGGPAGTPEVVVMAVVAVDLVVVDLL